MHFQAIDVAFNLLLLLFWLRAWSGTRPRSFYNPYLVRVDRAGEGLVNFLRPVFGRTPGWLVAALAFVFLLLLRALACPREMGGWALAFGFQAVRAAAASLPSCIAFSALSFGIFLYACWGLTLLLALLNPASRREGPAAFLAEISHPVSAVPRQLFPPLVLLCGTLLAAVLPIADAGQGGLPAASPVLLLLRFMIDALAAWVGLLYLVTQAMFWLIIGSLIGAASGTGHVAWFCQEWIDALLGPLRRYPIRAGMFDLTPLVYLLIIRFMVYPTLMGVLERAYARLI